LRKYGTTRLAEAGASEAQIMAFLAHRAQNETVKYREAARRKKLVSVGLALQMLPKMSNLNHSLDKNQPQLTEKKEIK
jgi:hypothetical protein